jgi:carnitine O-acetyltransferase
MSCSDERVARGLEMWRPSPTLWTPRALFYNKANKMNPFSTSPLNPNAKSASSSSLKNIKSVAQQTTQGKVIKTFPVPAEIPNAQSEKLATLPVPPLEHTLKVYLQTVRPFLNDDDFAQTSRAVAEFASGDGLKLQARLEERKRQADGLGPSTFKGKLVRDDKGIVAVTRNSWMIDWWNEYSYCAYREPVVIMVSYFFVFPDDVRTRIKPIPGSVSHLAKVGVNATSLKGSWGGGGTEQFDLQCERASRLVIGAMEFRKLLLIGKLALESSNPKDAKAPPLCMHQYRYMFNASRIPAVPSDYVETYSPVENEHIVVLRKNQFWLVHLVVDSNYTVDGKTTQGRRRISGQELFKQLRDIIDLSGTTSAIPLGTLSAMNRDAMSIARSLLLSHPSQPTPMHNSHLMSILESAVLLLCLDDTNPVTREEVSRNMWHGDGQNRWFDKSIQVIVCENGKAGLVGEHSMMDATPNTHCWNWVLDNLGKINHTQSDVSLEDALKGVEFREWITSDLEKPERLDFYIPESLLPTLATTLSTLTDVISHHDLQVLDFHPFGKNAIKTFGCSPDAFCQMAIQLAYFRLFGIVVATYESAGMRRYAWGRTETARSVCDDSVVQFLEAWCGDACESISVGRKAELCRNSCANQSKYMQMCQKGLGIDRHLLGLRLCLYPDEPLPGIYADPAYTLSSHWTLSTSQVASEAFTGYGWGPVVIDGFGVAYMVKNNSLFFNITGLIRVPGENGEKEANGTDMKSSRVQRFKHLLEESLLEMREVFLSAKDEEMSSPVPNIETVQRPPVSSFFTEVGSLRRRPSIIPEVPRPPTPVQHIETAATSGITHESVGLSLAYPPRAVLDDIVINDGVLEGLAEVELTEVETEDKRDGGIKLLTHRLLSWWGKE